MGGTEVSKNKARYVISYLSTAHIAASLVNACMSAPTNPGVFRAIFAKSKSGDKRKPQHITSNILKNIEKMMKEFTSKWCVCVCVCVCVCMRARARARGVVCCAVLWCGVVCGGVWCVVVCGDVW